MNCGEVGGGGGGRREKQRQLLPFAGEMLKYPKAFALNCSHLVATSSISYSEINKIMRRLCFQWLCCAGKYSAKGEDKNCKGRAESVVPVVLLQKMLYKSTCRPLFLTYISYWFQKCLFISLCNIYIE